MKALHRLPPSVLLLCCALAFISQARTETEPPSASSITSPRSAEAPEAILARIKPPEFPARDFPISDFGASAGGADCTDAIRKAIAACHDAGGGRVVVPAGVFHTGAIHLKSNVNLHLADGATLKFDPDPAKYLPVVLTRFEGLECMNYSPLIYALKQENIAVTGKGLLDGSSSNDNWWGWNPKKEDRKGDKSPSKQSADRKKLMEMGEAGAPVEQRVFGEGHFLRPSFIEPYRCKNVLIENVSIIGSPMWELHPTLSTNVTVRGVNIKSLGPNNDGCDPESCRDVLIENCVFETGDDCIAIKSGRNNDGRRVNVPAENTIVRGCTMKDGHGGVTIGSEISGSCYNVFVENCKMDSPELDRALRFKSNAQRGGVIENVVFRNVQVGRVGKAVLGVEFDYEEGAKGPHKPVLRNVLVENVTSEDSPRVVSITSFPGAVIENIRIANCTFRGVKSDNLIKDAPEPTLERVTIEKTK